MNENRGLWRGKRINNKEHNGEWVEGFLYPVKYTGSTIPGGIDYYIGTYPSGAGMQQIQVDPSTLGECTGKPDRKGKFIFEGDIVRAYKYGEEKFVNSISFKNGCFWFGNWNFTEFLDKFRNYEVIGNVYDNPELLEGGD